MSADVAAVLAHARHVPARQRAQLADGLRRHVGGGTVLVETCHRVEVYGTAASLSELPAGLLPAGTMTATGEQAAAHLVRLAVGRDSAVLAEDQLLHQLRLAVQEARARGPLAPSVDRLFDLALRAGRRARSWLPARRRTLADVAVERFIGRRGVPERPVLIVGAGEMGRQAAHSLSARGCRLLVASRTPERAAIVAAEVNARSVPFDPGAECLATVDGVVLALAGAWQLSDSSAAELRHSQAWVVDLSAPPALPRHLAGAVHDRLVSIDDLATTAEPPPSPGVFERLERLIDDTIHEYRVWSAHEAQRDAARALAEKAATVRAAELDSLWQRMPALAPEQRAEVERMARHLTESLLRDPLERLQQDGDGRQARAARELFRL